MLQRAAPAKVNLGLHIVRRRPDGYHDLETVFLRIPWADELSVRPDDGLAMTCSDPALPTDEGNLCLRAAQLLAASCGVQSGAALHLEKRIPYGAGLGGGSSDAAATLRLLAEHWGLAVPEATLHALAARLGSDVPFFLGAPAAFASGRGERLEPLLDPATGAPYQFPYALAVLVPPVHVPTPTAYRLIRPREADRPDLRAVVASNDLAWWREALVNDFEEPVCAAYPAVAGPRSLLYEAGAGYVAMSGSGSAMFGVFTEGAAAEAGRAAGYRAWWGGA
jgi:4-diphosphocytidyl-2-C-methyl-D-erythritol kinase